MVLGDVQDLGFNDSEVFSSEDELPVPKHESHESSHDRIQRESDDICNNEYKTGGIQPKTRKLFDSSESDLGYDSPSIRHLRTGHMKSVEKRNQNLWEMNRIKRQVTTKGIDTPLHHAIKSLDIDKIKELLNAGANLTAVNSAGQTPLQVIEERNTKFVVKLIQNFFLDKLPVVPLLIENILMCHKAGDIQSLHLLVFLTYITHRTLPNNFYRNGVYIQFKQRKIVSQEANILGQMKNSYSYEKIPPILDGKTADKLFKEHSNLNIIACSERKSVGFAGDHRVFHQPCYVLFCHCKSLIPYGENQFPKFIEGLPTDVREGYFEFGSNQQIQIGKSILRRDIRKTGTIGGFVDLDNNQTGLITCAHTFYSLSELRSQSLPLEIPVSTAFDEEDFGKITRAVFTPDDPGTVSVDAALVKLWYGNTAISNFPEISQIQLDAAGKSTKTLLLKLLDTSQN